MKASSGADGALLWKIRIVGMILFVAPIVITIWAARIRDLAPDFLTRISPDYFERDGLCFLFLVEKSQSRARMVLCYQNRFEKPCEANVFIGPTPIALGDLAGLPNFQFSLSLKGGEFGKQSLAWSVPSRFQGGKVLWDVAAKVKYPAGRGVLLRGRNGANVGDHLVGVGEEAVKALASVIISPGSISGRSARTELKMPAGEDSDVRQPSELLSETIWKWGDPINY